VRALPAVQGATPWRLPSPPRNARTTSDMKTAQVETLHPNPRPGSRVDKLVKKQICRLDPDQDTYGKISEGFVRRLHLDTVGSAATLVSPSPDLSAEASGVSVTVPGPQPPLWMKVRCSAAFFSSTVTVCR
jgi:hypothetical protein